MLGAKVALVEKDRLGGDCTCTGCIPTKAMIRTAKVASLMRRAPEFCLNQVPVDVDFPAVMARMRSAVRHTAQAASPERFRTFGFEVMLEEPALFVSGHEVLVGDRRLSFRAAIPAAGAHSTLPPVEGLAETGSLRHETILDLERLPRSMAIVGCEFAQIFARLGCRVEMLSSSPLPLPKEDREASSALRRIL